MGENQDSTCHGMSLH